MDQESEATATVSSGVKEKNKTIEECEPTKDVSQRQQGKSVPEAQQSPTAGPANVKATPIQSTIEAVEAAPIQSNVEAFAAEESQKKSIEVDTHIAAVNLDQDKNIETVAIDSPEELPVLEKIPTIDPNIENDLFDEMPTLAVSVVVDNPIAIPEKDLESQQSTSKSNKLDYNVETIEKKISESSEQATIEPQPLTNEDIPPLISIEQSTESQEKTPEIETNVDQTPELPCESHATTDEIPSTEPCIVESTEKPPSKSIGDLATAASSNTEDKTDACIMEMDLDSTDKEESTEKNDHEPEITEFIQIQQDKADDSAIEGQSMDAEDPFGGEDSLAGDTVEILDNDELERDINFRKLGDQADNLQDVLKAKDPVTNDETAAQAVESNNSAENKINTDTIASIPSENEKTVEKNKKSNDQVENSTDEQSAVLPGQDDEICIIPDNMKIILPKSNATTSTETVQDTEKSTESHAIAEKPTETIVVIQETSKAPVITDKPDKAPASQAIIESTAKITESVIDLEDESKRPEIEEITTLETCKQCKSEKSCKIKVKLGSESFNVCSKECQAAFATENNRATDIPSESANSKYEKRCANCLLLVETADERNLSWETMEFCNEECLGKFQTKYGSYCRNCNGNVAAMSLGKYCVRFGYDVRQFCCSTCLEEFKKGLKVCSYCQKDISTGTDGFLAPVGDKGQFKDFCTQFCMEKYSKMNSTEPPSAEKKACSVCQEEKIVHCEVQVDRAAPVAICSEPCFAAFKFVNKVDPNQCSTCKKYFEQVNKKSFVVFDNNEAHTFCNKTCLNIYIITHRKIVPCSWCKVKKYNFDMIKKDLKNGQSISMCSLNCLTLYQVSVNAVSSRRINCDFCKEFSQAQYHLTMSDATIRNFCAYECVMKFQGQYTKSPITIPAGDDSAPVPTGTPKRTYPGKLQTQSSTVKPVEIANLSNLTSLPNLQTIQSKKVMPVISSVTSLASNGQSVSIPQKSSSTVTVAVNNASITNASVASGPQIIYKQQVITQPPSPVRIHNKMTQCKPLMHTKGVSVKPHPCNKSTQTDEVQKILVPIPVPIYVPFPVHMWSFPFPVPMPFPLPIPVPIFIPTTRNSAKGIFKEIKRIQEKMPSDPFEAELLMMAEMVATEKKTTESDSVDSEEEEEEEEEETTTEEPVDTVNSFGDDMLQMALKMATGEIEEPAVDLEAALTPNTITVASATTTESSGDGEVTEGNRTATGRGKKRVVTNKPRGGPVKRGRRTSVTTNDTTPLMPPPETQPASNTPRIVEPVEKPDANMALKYTFGVNAWRKWVIAKNIEIEKQTSQTRKTKPFKIDLLQLTADELNYTLCLFVKEVRKPNGAEYAPDTIYYLCLGIQQYLFENNRIDNIFTDTYYEQFTDCLNDVAKKFSVLYNDAQYIVTRVEEEHLWECKQLGAHSPHVLLSTLMFFNTKHFNLVTVEEHMQLSFSHIMKHWKRNPAAQAAAVAGKAPGSRNVLLRFYPPASALEANSKKKKVYEQQENEENPLRCPVKLYEFYLSKCPESVKTRNDVFYLLPERSCVPDSPVWYSTSPLAKEHLVKMLHRVKMVKEINVALLST